ncbi:hypothetical protein [Spiroplasma turonicum]|uniref:Lipoprotein n=1 Tax=Spiroplasma turonicum TaxID=216946 RepID=A0A0K1P5S6_9MOLU|nr:hypothetical protein [Spiroplasma turonicum]AKU79272.1 hypothetical protein STURON_0026 [Spiroplasma turonicum]ALX70295.1 hypothetical protein STURO_v1c00260 [Spiroplasma turonicum]
MKKLLSIMTSILVSSSTALSTISCGSAPTDSLDILVAGEKEYELNWRGEDKKIEAFDLFSNDKNKLLTNLTIQILEAITYKDSKYQNADKREKEKKFLGDSGLGMSLDYILNDSYNGKKANLEFNDDTTKNEFIEDYTKSSKNTRFKSFNYDVKDVKLDDLNLSAKLNDEKNVTTFNGSNTFGVALKKEYNENGELDSSSELINEEGFFVEPRQKSLKNYYDLTWEKYVPKLFENDKANYFSEYKDKKVFAMSSDDADSFYDTLTSNITVESKKLVEGTDKKTFNLIHKQLEDKADKTEIGFLMPSEFSFKESNINSSLSDFSEEAYDISNGAKLFKQKEGNDIQAQDSKETKDRTFVYTSTEKMPDVVLDFLVPDNQNDKSYEIRIKGMNNLVVGLSLANFKISEVKDDSKGKTRTDQIYYWYEPTIYQFSKNSFFKIGSENMFNSLEVENVEIIISKK